MLTFYYDVVCPYAYLAATRVDALAARNGTMVDWKPVLLGGIFKEIGAPAFPAEGQPEPKQALGRKDILRQADRLGVELSIPEGHPRRTVDAMRLIVSAPEPLRPDLSKALFAEYWVHGADIADIEVLGRVARRFDLDIDAISSPEVKQSLVDRSREAALRGVFGVPTFFVGETMRWGLDRLHFVEMDLGAGRVEPRAPTVKSGETVGFFHDLASPFSYLASTRIERLCRRQGAAVDWRPILLGALFRDIGTPDVPMATFSAEKQRYMLQDLFTWAEYWGVPFEWPACFPVRSVLPLRVSLVEPRATPALYRALWVEGRDIGEAAELHKILDEVGLPAAEILARTQDPAIKLALRENTEAAQAAGVCGVPTFQLEDGMIIWGQDRLFLLDQALSGWRPRPEAR